VTTNREVFLLEAAIEKAKLQVQGMGVKPQHVDAVAAVLVSYSWTQSDGLHAKSLSVRNEQTSPQFEETFSEWAAHYNIQSHVDRFVAIAVYLLDRQQQRSLDTEIAIQMYKEARWKQPHNPADVFSKGAARLFFAVSKETDEKSSLKQWGLTKTGYQHLSSLKKEI
jgi:hypothetical protein